MTSIDIEVQGVEVSELHPSPLPDIFSGGQLVAVGRYDQPGEATVILRGAVRGEPTTRTFENVAFGGDGGDDTIPRLWATRKIGDLLRQVRLEGADEETIDQIVRLSIRWGIVTPYTSYLVEGDAPFGEEALDEITRAATRSAQSTTAPASGEAAFDAADVAASMSDSDLAAPPDEQYADVVRVAGGRTFLLIDGVWIDTTYDPDMATIRVPFGSTEYFALAASNRSLSVALTVGASMVVVYDGFAYEIVPADASGDPLPTTANEDPEISATDDPAAPAESGRPIAIIVVASAAALAATAGLLRSATRKS
jgi:Ca-activated chloride channel family protein